MNHTVTVKLLVIIACYAVLAFIGSRKLLRPLEITILGVAMIFWATAWLIATLVQVTVPIYGRDLRAGLIAGVMALPMTLAMSVGLWILVKRMRKNAGGASAPPSPLPRKRAKNKPRRQR